MVSMVRRIVPAVIADLRRKMVLISGPRQVGKTHLARQIADSFGRSLYLNYDNPQDREIIDNQGWSPRTELLILDEIHKRPGWKGYAKGIYDTRPPTMAMLLTGSARLSTFREGGESMAGRYYHHRLLPITPAEARHAGIVRSSSHFLQRGGFPEPFLVEADDDAGRWRRFYLDGLIREDILDFENIRRLREMNLLVELLRRRVGSPLSYQSLAEDTGAAPNTIRHYIDVLEALYIVFRVYPHHRSIARSIARQPKLYFYDTGCILADDGARFENHVAVTILAELALLEDADGSRRDLRYLRTKEGKEVDFVIVHEDEPTLMIEAKLSDRRPSPSLAYFQERYRIPGIQLVEDIRLERHDGIPVLRAHDWLEEPAL